MKPKTSEILKLVLLIIINYVVNFLSRGIIKAQTHAPQELEA